jgi:hypothetical protein
MNGIWELLFHGTDPPEAHAVNAQVSVDSALQKLHSVTRMLIGFEAKSKGLFRA